MKRQLALVTTLCLGAGLFLAAPAYAVDTPVLVSGYVLNNGTADNDATVEVDIWPNAAALAALADDAQVPMWTVSGTTNASGYYKIELDGDTVPAEYFSPTNTADMTVRVVNSANKTASWSITAKKGYVSAGVSVNWASTVVYGGGLAMLTFEMGSSPQVTEAGAQAATLVDDLGNETQGTGVFPLEVVEYPGVCYTTASTWYYNKPEKFLDAYTWSGAQISLWEDTSSAHTLGVGITYNSGTSWSANGTMSLSVTSGAGDNAAGLVNKRIFNRVNYRKFNRCYGQALLRPVEFFDVLALGLSQNLLGGIVMPQSYCSLKLPGQNPYKTKGSNVTFSSGVAVGPISLSANAAFSASTKIQFVITLNSWVCGNTAAGWISSPYATAHAG